MNQIQAPFTPEQVDQLNRYQVGVGSIFGGHPFTCANRDAGITSDTNGVSNTMHATHGTEGGDRGVLIATEAGWVCPHCGHTQDWAHEFMTLPPSIEDEGVIDRALRSAGVNTSLRLRDKLDSLIESYSALRNSRKISVYQTDEENAKTDRIWSLTAVMLASLRRRRMELMGVHINAQKEIYAIEPQWIDLNVQKPNDHENVYVLWQDQPFTSQSTFAGHTATFGGVSNPGHEGYGCNAWISIRQFEYGGVILSTGGDATHWCTIEPIDELTPKQETPQATPTALDTDWISVKERLPAGIIPCDWLFPMTELKRERWILCGESILTASVPGNATHWRPAQKLPN